MASPSPAEGTGGAIDGFFVSSPLSSASSKSLRGLNKPKCIKCGNVARSRCPYQSCKRCCAKAQNPCHIHVLKGSSSLPEKPPSSSSPLSEQQSTDASHSGNSHRLHHLSSNFAQFSSLQTPVRPRKPLTRKDAQVINDWRFMKLKEFKDGKALAESEAFDRYMKNVSLLEEVFSVSSDDQFPDHHPSVDEENTESLINSMSLKLRSDVIRTENFRKRIKDIVDEELGNLRNDIISHDTEIERPDKKMKISSSQSDRENCFSEVMTKLDKAKSEDEFKECQELASQVLLRCKSKVNQTGTDENDFKPQQESYLLGKWFSSVTVDQECICKIDEKFSSLDEIEDL